MKSKKYLTLVLALVMCLSIIFAACGNTNDDEPQVNTNAPASAEKPSASDETNAPSETEEPDYHYTLNPSSWQENGFWAKHIDLWAEYVTENTDGRVTVEPSLPGAIVPVDQQMDAVSTGLTGAMAIPSAYYSGVIPLGYVWSVPPVVQSVSDMKEFNEEYADGRAGDLWSDAIEDEYNVVVIGYMYGPADVPISSKVPLNSIADLKGVKLRVGAGAIADTLASFGASCVFAPSSESYTMLSTNAIDAVVTGSPADNLAASFAEVTSYWVREPYLNTTHATTLVINRDIWESLTPEDQKVLLDGVEYSTDIIETEGAEKIAKAWEEVEEAGITICIWPKEDQTAWAKAFYDTCAQYSDDPDYLEYIDLLGTWAVEKGYFSE